MKHFYRVLILISGVIIGVFASNFEYFKLDSSISLSDIISVVIASSLGLYIADTIQSKLNNNKSEKDIITNELKEILIEINNLKQQNNRNLFQFRETVNLFKELNQSVNLVKTLLTESSNCKHISIDNVHDDIIHLRAVITGISPVNDIIYTNSVRNEVDKRLTVLKTSLYKIMFKINKA